MILPRFIQRRSVSLLFCFLFHTTNGRSTPDAYPLSISPTPCLFKLIVHLIYHLFSYTELLESVASKNVGGQVPKQLQSLGLNKIFRNIYRASVTNGNWNVNKAERAVCLVFKPMIYDRWLHFYDY